jgi:hypothetical protein
MYASILNHHQPHDPNLSQHLIVLTVVSTRLSKDTEVERQTGHVFYGFLCCINRFTQGGREEGKMSIFFPTLPCEV